MQFVRDILAVKGRQVHCVRPDTRVIDALRTMAEHEIGALVVRHGSLPIGLFGEREYARRVILRGRSSGNLSVADVMTTDVPSVALEESIERCMQIMTTERVRHLPVIDERTLAGLVSIGDVVRAVIAEQQHTIGELHQYIARVR